MALAACRPDPLDPECRRAAGYVGAPRIDVAAEFLDGRQAGSIEGALPPAQVERLSAALSDAR